MTSLAGRTSLAAGKHGFRLLPCHGPWARLCRWLWQHFARALALVSSDFEGLRDHLVMSGADVFIASREPLTAWAWTRSVMAIAQADLGAYEEQLPVQ